MRVENFMEPRVLLFIFCERLAPAIISIMHIKWATLRPTHTWITLLFMNAEPHICEEERDMPLQRRTESHANLSLVCYCRCRCATSACDPCAVPLIIDYGGARRQFRHQSRRRAVPFVMFTQREPVYIKLSRENAPPCYRTLVFM